MEQEEENILFAIDLGLSDTESAGEGSSATAKHPRDYQSEEDFLIVKRDWRARVEGVGSLYRSHEEQVPTDQPSKPLSQALLHAIEELYFKRRYEEAGRFAEEVLKGDLDEPYKNLVEGYRERCLSRAKESRGR